MSFRYGPGQTAWLIRWILAFMIGLIFITIKYFDFETLRILAITMIIGLVLVFLFLIKKGIKKK